MSTPVSSRSSPSTQVAAAFREYERLLWGVAYRMTGGAADADDVVQETFRRALEHPPARLDEPLRPWLIAVAMNVARDALRERKRRPYVGTWLPSPVDDDDLALDAPSTEARYELRESVSYAFLLALEALTPLQRAVLLLRDVLDYSVRETAEVLRVSENHVKVTHHRARRAMAAYEQTRGADPSDLEARTRASLERFLTALALGDAAGAAACLTSDALLRADGGGEFASALRPLEGADRIYRFLVGVQAKRGQPHRYGVRTVNGLPAVIAEYDGMQGRWAPRFVLRCEVDAAGAIREVHIVLATPKLGRIAPL
ncbi:MAG TPA: sigma-70 family RNA polymerase sigma factor [Polyangiaceae bacterium]